MCQEGLVRFWLALNLRAGDHAHGRDQIVGRCRQDFSSHRSFDDRRLLTTYCFHLGTP
jgi:hypothetical protein